MSPHERPASPGQGAVVVAGHVAPGHAQLLLVTHSLVQSQIIEAVRHHSYGSLNFLDQSLRIYFNSIESLTSFPDQRTSSCFISHILRIKVDPQHTRHKVQRRIQVGANHLEDNKCGEGR